MGNPQERSLAWLAGVLEAEGSISVQVYTLPDGRVRLTPYVCLVNTDQAILDEAIKTLTELCDGGKAARPRYCGHGGTNRPCHVVRLDGPNCKRVLEALLPYMIGEKRRNAKVVIEFCDQREERLLKRNKLGQIQRQGYTREQIELISSIRTHKTAKSSETICRAPNVVG